MCALISPENCVAEIPVLNLPDVCTSAPEHESAFCRAHCQLLEAEAPEIPTGLRDFLKYCGVSQAGEYCGHFNRGAGAGTVGLATAGPMLKLPIIFITLFARKPTRMCTRFMNIILWFRPKVLTCVSLRMRRKNE